MLNIKKTVLHNSIHVTLAHSYVAYFISFLLGLFFYFLFPIKISNYKFTVFLGFVFLLFASFLIFWAQKTSRKLNKTSADKEIFCKGPYCYTHMPTQFGLFFLMFGFGLIINSFFIILFSLISLTIHKLFFVKKQENILLEKYGASYLEYKKFVKF